MGYLQLACNLLQIASDPSGASLLPLLVTRAGMKRTLVIATVDWAKITGSCLVLAEGGFGVPGLIETSDEGAAGSDHGGEHRRRRSSTWCGSLQMEGQ